MATVIPVPRTIIRKAKPTSSSGRYTARATPGQAAAPKVATPIRKAPMPPRKCCVSSYSISRLDESNRNCPHRNNNGALGRRCRLLRLNTRGLCSGFSYQRAGLFASFGQDNAKRVAKLVALFAFDLDTSLFIINHHFAAVTVH